MAVTPPVAVTLSKLAAQAEAVALAAANHRGHVQNLSNMRGTKRERPAHELEFAKRYLPDLEAAAKTIAAFVPHEEALRDFLATRNAKPKVDPTAGLMDGLE